MKNKKLLLIDGNSLMFRSYYATAYAQSNLMRNAEGVYTNALFGFCNMFNKLLQDDVNHIFVAFDAGSKTFRHQQYDEYKAGRKPLPEELKMQIPLIKEYLDLLGVARLESSDYEADDLIATAATRLSKEFEEVLVVSGDKDLLQLTGGNIQVALTKKGVGELDIYTEENFSEKMGFMPCQLVDYKGIAGDTSDNLKGVKGVGEKTAIKLINEYKSLEGIYENLEKLTPKVKSAFIEYKDSAVACKNLATLERNADVLIDINTVTKKDTDIKKLTDFYKKMEFNSFLKKLVSSNASTNQNKDNYQLTEIGEKLTGTGFLVLELLGTNYLNNLPIGFGLVIDNNKYFIHESDLHDQNKYLVIKEYLENEKNIKIVFDYKALYVSFKKYNIELKGIALDMLISSYLINPAYASDDFKKVADAFKDNDLLYYENVYGQNSKMTVPCKEEYINYSISKCLFLKENYLEILKETKNNNLDFLVNEEIKLSKVLGEMEYNGLKIDLERLEEIGEDLNNKANCVKQNIYNASGCEFNINSVKQLGEVLFEKLKLPHGKKNKTGYSTSVDVLQKLSEKYEIVRDILKYRAYTKLVSTYVNGLIEVSKNSFIHPLYKQALTTTGRLSAVEPNIQNMPIRTEEGQVIREVFVSRFEGGEVISADYSQIELRVLAHMSNDEKMINAFNMEADFHRQTASEIFEVSLEDVTSEMRRAAKAINFGIIYGMSPWGLSEQIGVTPLEANIFINKYFSNYSKAKDCLDKFVASAYEKGYSQTLYGRIRYIQELHSSNGNIRSFGERTAMNSPIQGTAADIIKIAMNKVYDEIVRNNMKSIMIAQVHDELLFDCPRDEIEKMKEIVSKTMTEAVNLNVPLAIGIASGKNWFSAK